MNRNELITAAKASWELAQRRKINPIKYFKPQPYQQGFWNSLKKEKLIIGGNRSGKTINGAAYCIDKCIKENNLSVWGSTWADMSIAVQQKKIKELLPRNEVSYADWSEQRGFTNKIIIFKSGSAIRFKTYDQGAESFQGTNKDIIWNDEEPPMDVYHEEKARLIDNDGEILTTMTPLNGITYIYTDIINNPMNKDIIDYWYWDTSLNSKINQEAFRRIIGQYDEKEAQVRSKGTFMNMNFGRLYYVFDRDIFVKPLEVNPDLPLRLSFDFNVNPMTTGIFQIVPGTNSNEQRFILNVLETVNSKDSNTRDQCEFLRKKLQGWNNQIIIYGDATNIRRTETADVNDTNWTIVRNYFPNAIYKVPDFNPNIKERVSWVNAKFMNFDNKIGIYINNENCEELITDLEQGIWAKDGKSKDKKNPMLNHNTDNFDYIIAEEFPLHSAAFSSTDFY